MRQSKTQKAGKELKTGKICGTINDCMEICGAHDAAGEDERISKSTTDYNTTDHRGEKTT